MTSHYVYIIQQNDSSPADIVKIGYTGRLNARLSSLQNASPYSLSLVAAVECRSSAEAVMIEACAHQLAEQQHRRMRGEWFAVTGSVDGILDDAAQKAGVNVKPVTITDTAQKPTTMAKSAGLTGLAEVSRITGTGYSTLHEWSRTRPRLLEAVILGCAAIKRGQTDEERQKA